MPAKSKGARELHPDLILLDNHLDGVNGVDALPALQKATPSARMLMLTVSVIAHEMTSKLVMAYSTAANGANDAPPDPTPVSSLASLKPRKLDIPRAVTTGASNKEIARQFAIAETTVKIHVQHILRKLDVSSRMHAAVMAAERGLLRFISSLAPFDPGLVPRNQSNRPAHSSFPVPVHTFRRMVPTRCQIYSDGMQNAEQI